jgi:hypothetical protein
VPQPSFEVEKYEMNDRHELFGNLRIAPFGNGHVVVAMPGEPGVAALVIAMIMATGAMTSPLTARTTAHPGFINISMFFRFLADQLLVAAHHTDAGVMKDLERALTVIQLIRKMLWNSGRECRNGESSRASTSIAALAPV